MPRPAGRRGKPYTWGGVGPLALGSWSSSARGAASTCGRGRLRPAPRPRRRSTDGHDDQHDRDVCDGCGDDRGPCAHDDRSRPAALDRGARRHHRPTGGGRADRRASGRRRRPPHLHFDLARLPGWQIAFLPPHTGFQGRTFPDRGVEVYVSSGNTARAVSYDLAHEIGHAVDLTYSTRALRLAYRSIRGIPAATLWFGCAIPDFATPSGDFAESFGRRPPIRVRLEIEMGPAHGRPASHDRRPLPPVM